MTALNKSWIKNMSEIKYELKSAHQLLQLLDRVLELTDMTDSFNMIMVS